MALALLSIVPTTEWGALSERGEIARRERLGARFLEPRQLSIFLTAEIQDDVPLRSPELRRCARVPYTD
jgi:hypothetical protein